MLRVLSVLSVLSVLRVLSVLSVLQCAVFDNPRGVMCCSVLQRVEACCSVLQRVAACYSVLQRVAACCSVLQCVAVCWVGHSVCCSVLIPYGTVHQLQEKRGFQNF